MKRAELNFCAEGMAGVFVARCPFLCRAAVLVQILRRREPTFFILYYCLRYRMKVVNENLRNSFPEKSVGGAGCHPPQFLPDAGRDIRRYGQYGPYGRREKARTVLTVKGFDEHYKAVHGRDWIAMTAHFGCWEYCSYWGALRTLADVGGGVSSPCAARSWSGFYQRLRNYENSMTVAMKDSLALLPAQPGMRRGR